MESFTNSCRLCLWKGDKMLPIFTSPDDDETALKIRKCLPLDVRWEDNLPKGICASCLYKVEMLYEFHCSAVRVDSLLRKYLSSEIKDVNIKEQQLNGTGYQLSGAHTMRSVAIGTEDEYVPSAIIRECRESSTDVEPVIARVRVRTPFDISNMNSVGTGTMVLLHGSDGCTTSVPSLGHRSDSAQGIDSVGTHAVGGTEQSAASSRVLCFSPSGTTVQQEGSRQPEPQAHTSSQVEACVAGGSKSTGETDIVCLSMKSSQNMTQNDLSTIRSCKHADDDEVVVLAEYQKPPQPNRRCKTPIPFESTSPSAPQDRKSHRLCARHQEYLRLVNLQQEQRRLQQQGLPHLGTQKATDQLPQRPSEQVPAASTPSASLALSDASRQVQCDATQQAAQEQSSGGGTRSNSTESEEHVQSHAQSRPASGATSSVAACVGSEVSHNIHQPGQLERACHVMRTEHRGATTGAVGTPLCNSTTAESSQTKQCGYISSSAEATPPVAAAACMPPPAAPLPAFTPKPAVPPPSPTATPIPAPPSSAVPTPSATLITTSEQIPSAGVLKNLVPVSSAVPPGTPVTTQSAVSPVVTSSVIRPTVTSHSGRTATHSPSPVRSPSGERPPSNFTPQISSAQEQSQSHSKSKSLSSGQGHSSKSPLPTPTPRSPPPPVPSTPSATLALPPLAPLTTSVTWPVSVAPTPPPSILRVSAQLQQQETRQQRALLPARGSAHPEQQVIQAKLQDGVFKFPTFLVVANASFHPQTQPEQQGKVSQVLHNVSPVIEASNLSAHSQPSAAPQTPTVPKEEEQKPQLEQTRSPGKAISQLIAASALISPPRGSKEPEQQVKKLGEAQTKSIGQSSAIHLPAAPPHFCAHPKQHERKSQVQCEQQKNRQQVPCDKLSGKTGRQPAASPVDTESKGGSAQTGQSLSGADRQLPAAATSPTVGQSSKRKRDHRSHSVIAEMLATPAKNVAGSPTSEQPKHVKQKHRTAQSLSERSLLKSTVTAAPVVKSSAEIAEKDKQTPQVTKSYLSGGNIELHQDKKPPALQNSEVSLKWKKKKKKKKEKEEEEEEDGSRHRSSNKYQQEQLSHKRKHPSRNTRQPGDPPPKPAPAPSPQQNQKTETASRHSSSQSQSTTVKYELSGGEAEQPQVERWRNVQQDAVERVRSAVRESVQPPLPDPVTSPPPPSSTAKTPLSLSSSTMKTPSSLSSSTAKTLSSLSSSTAKTPSSLSSSTTKTPSPLSSSTAKTPSSLSSSTTKTPSSLPTSTMKTPSSLPTSTVKTPSSLPTSTVKTPSPLPSSTVKTPSPLPSSTVKTPPPPILTPQRRSPGSVPPTSPSPTPPKLPPAFSTVARTNSPESTDPLPQCTTPPLDKKSPPTPFLTPPDAADQQKYRSQPPPKAVAEVSERRLRTPSPATSTGSTDWPSMSHRSGTSPRRYYNRKRRHSDRSTGEPSGVGRDGSNEAVDGAEMDPLPQPEAPPPRSTLQPPAAHPAQTSMVRPEPHRQPLSSPNSPHKSAAGTPLLLPRSARVFRYSCRYCRQRFRARILLSLHRVNGACELHRSHDYARGGGGRDRPRVTERELMLAARVRLERVHACPRCSRVLSNENTLKWHLAVRHGRDNPRDTRSTLHARWRAPTPPPYDTQLLPFAGKSSDCKDTMLEALGLTRKT